MHQRERSDAAARRLALIAADLGATSAGPATSEAAEVAPAVDEPWWADHTRVAGGVIPEVDPLAAAPTLPSEPTVGSRPAGQGGHPRIPTPGRHAARRQVRPPWAGAATRLPVLTTAHVAVVALAVAIGLAVTTWWVVRDDPAPATAPVAGEPVAPLLAGEAAVPDPPTEGTSTGGPTTTVTVDVAGKVRRPGIVVLTAGARVTDALEAAGGARRGVDLTALNLARVLVDGEQVVVGMPGSTALRPGATADGAGGAGPSGPLVNLNLAGQTELEGLPQIGPVTAQAIVAWRDQRGGFTSIDELLEIDGIGDKTLEKLRPYVTI